MLDLGTMDQMLGPGKMQRMMRQSEPHDRFLHRYPTETADFGNPLVLEMLAGSLEMLQGLVDHLEHLSL